METIDTFRPKYQAFLESNMSARAFCGQIGMNESHFYYWQAKIRKEAARQNGGFLPVSINNHAGKVVLYRRTRDELDENGSSRLRNRLSQRRDCPPVWRYLRTDAQPVDNDRAIADVQPYRNRFFLYPHPTDMRKSFYTLSGIVTNQMSLDVQDGGAFIFINKPCTSMKILHVECCGLVIFTLFGHIFIGLFLQRYGFLLSYILTDQSIDTVDCCYVKFFSNLLCCRYSLENIQDRIQPVCFIRFINCDDLTGPILLVGHRVCF